MGVKLQSALGGSVELTAPSTASTYSIAVPAGNGTMAMTSSLTGFKNKLLNGDFRIWQRGSTFISTTDGYKADRWAVFRETGPTTKSVTRITLPNGELPGMQFSCRIQRVSGNTDATNGIWFMQNFETGDSIPYQGKQLTVSFWAKKGANFSAASSNLITSVITGTGTDQAYNAGWTGQGEVAYTTHTLTTSWQRFTYTFTLPTTATQFKPTFRYYPTGTAGANDYFDIAGIQMEVGLVATEFEPRPYVLELALCQRYYYILSQGALYGTFTIEGTGSGLTQSYVGGFLFPTTMRTSPSCTVSVLDVHKPNVRFDTITYASVNNPSPDYAYVLIGTTTSDPGSITVQPREFVLTANAEI